MSNSLKNKIKTLTAGIVAIFATAISFATPAFAGSFSVSPMYQLVSLTPGETYVGNFEIVNPGTNTETFYYQLRIEPFSVDNDDDISLVSNGDYNQIIDWIELSEPSGTILPNAHKEIRFTINVPKDAPAGGQYVSIVVSSGEYRVDNSTVDLREVYEAAHLIYADVAGETVRKGDFEEVGVKSFLFSGNITGSARIKNEGNVHSIATQTMQVYPLFSKEEVFTNEEDPKEVLIMPGNTLYSSISWDGTPSLGVFRVIYNVEFEGVESTVDKMVIVCPLWLLFILLACLFIVLFAIIFGGKRNNKS